MIKFHVLNVEKGDSIIVENTFDGASYFGLIDCNSSGNNNVVLRKLQALGVTRLSFVALTHPHDDHYSGMLEVLNHFRGSIDEFYSFPMGEALSHAARLRKLTEQLLALQQENDSIELRRKAFEFIGILRFAHEMGDRWSSELFGPSNAITPIGFDNVKIRIIQPPPVTRGPYLQKIMAGKLDSLGHSNDNELSLAFMFDIGERKVILGGDATKGNWLIHRDRYQRVDRISADMVKLPHHGSGIDCSADVLETLFKATPDACGIISANGKSHPSQDVLAWLLNNQIQPYCTNVATLWGATPVVNMPVLPGYTKEIRSMVALRMVEAEGRPSVCCGDICYQVADDGVVTVTTEYNNICGCRMGQLAALVG